MAYYEYHYLVKDLSEHLKQEKEANDKQNDAVNSQAGAYKQPKMPNMKMPSMSTPKMPKI